MSPTGKKLITILGIVTVVFAGYYFFTQDSTSAVFRSTESDRQLEQMLTKTREFVEHQRVLNGVTINTDLFSDPTFTQLRDYSPEPFTYRVKRNNPFITAPAEQPVGAATEVFNVSDQNVSDSI